MKIKFKSIPYFFIRIKNAIKLAYWAFTNPTVITPSIFKMLSDLLVLILKVANEDKHMMTHIAYVHPEEGEKQIVSIWAGAGIAAEPTKRIKELLEENRKLKIIIAKHGIVNAD